MYVALAVRFHWTPEQVGSLDPDFLIELIAYLDAEADATQARQNGAH